MKYFNLGSIPVFFNLNKFISFAILPKTCPERNMIAFTSIDSRTSGSTVLRPGCPHKAEACGRRHARMSLKAKTGEWKSDFTPEYGPDPAKVVTAPRSRSSRRSSARLRRCALHNAEEPVIGGSSPLCCFCWESAALFCYGYGKTKIEVPRLTEPTNIFFGQKISHWTLTLELEICRDNAS